jgi:RES domain-containing protein
VSLLPVWRLCAAHYAGTAFDGEGARLFGGRWSPRGVAITYTAESRALAVLEVLANVDEPDRLYQLAWVLIPAGIPQSLIEKPARFPEDWRSFPRTLSTQALGESWSKARSSVALRVPSAVVPGEFNYLINPLHPRFDEVKIGKPEPFTFDPRLRP